MRNRKIGKYWVTLALVVALAALGLQAFAAGEDFSPKTAELNTLVNDMRSGGAFALDEFYLLERFAAGEPLTVLEADTLLSRALYVRFTDCSELTGEQAGLLKEYDEWASGQDRDALFFKAANQDFEAWQAKTAPARTEFAVPPNDLCGGAAVIPGAGPFPYLDPLTYDLTDATETAGDPTPSCQASHSRSIWYSFTPAALGTYTFSVCQSDAPLSTRSDTIIGVYTSAGGCAGPWTQVGCDDDSCTTLGLQSIVTVSCLNPGTTYYIVVWSYGSSIPSPAIVQLRVSQSVCIPPPANDQCAGAINIPVGPFPILSTITPDITYATQTGDPTGLTCASSSAYFSVWYTFTPGSTGMYSIQTCSAVATGTTVLDTILGVFTGGCAGPWTQVACSDGGCSSGSQSFLTATLTAGTTYYIVVYKYGSTAPAAGQTAVQVAIDQVFPPPNDICASAQALTLNQAVQGTTALGTNDYTLTGTTCFQGIGQGTSTAPGRDVVYSFTPAVAGNYSVKVSLYSASGNPVVYLSTTCPAPGALTCSSTTGPVWYGSNRNTTQGAEVLLNVPLVAATPYYIFVDENGSTFAGSPFTIVVTPTGLETEVNDTPAQANAVQCGIEGSRNPVGDYDFFYIGAPGAGWRVFGMVDGAAGGYGAGSSSNDFDLRVTNSTDTLEYDDANNDAPFGGLAPNCSGTPLTAGSAFLKVNHWSTSNLYEPYQLFLAIQPPIAFATAETEPNGTTGTANTSLLDYFSGTLPGPAPSTDVDVFAFTANLGDVILLGLDGDPLRDNSPIDGKLELLNSAGTLILGVNDSGSTSSLTTTPGNLHATGPTSPAEALYWRAQYTGTYYARVTIGGTGTGTPYAGDYLLSIAKNCATPVATDLQVTKVDFPSPVGAGNQLTYTITVTNAGPHPAFGVALAEGIPVNSTFVSLTVPAGWTTPAIPAGQAGPFPWSSTIATLPVGTYVFTMVVAIPGAIPAGTIIDNTATGTMTTPDLDPSNNSATTHTTVASGSADLGITKTGTPDPCIVGADLTYTINVTNVGPAPGTNVQVVDTLPANTAYQSASGTGWTCGVVGQVVTCTCAVAPVFPGVTPPLTIVVKPTAGGLLHNVATISATEADPNPANNTATFDSQGFQPVMVTGQKFEDLNANGAKDAGEAGLPGWVIELRQSPAFGVIATATTDANGNFLFPNVANGTFRVTEQIQPSWIQTTATPADFTTVSGVDVTGLDFGNYYCSLTCSASWTALPVNQVVPVTVTFDASVSVFAGCPQNPVAWTLDFGDGASATETNASHTWTAAHTYNVAGSYTWTLTVVLNGVTCTQSGIFEAKPFDLSFYDEYGRSQVCVNSVTGAWSWRAFTPPGIPPQDGVGRIVRQNGVFYLYSLPNEPWKLYLKYLPAMRTANGSFQYRIARINSQLYDRNTTNNPPGC